MLGAEVVTIPGQGLRELRAALAFPSSNRTTPFTLPLTLITSEEPPPPNIAVWDIKALAYEFGGGVGGDTPQS